MAGDRRPFDAFFKITSEGELVVVAVGGRQYEATPDAAREIARNLLRKAEVAEEARRVAAQGAARRGHLRRVK